jgi:ATP-binding cassette subfamily B multidrug efflux pump
MPPQPRQPILRLLTVYAWRHRWRYLAGACCLVLTNWLTVEIPLSIGQAIDLYRESHDPTGAIFAVGLMGALVIGVRTLSRVFVFNPGRDVEADLRNDLFDDLCGRRASFFAQRRTGDIISRASNDMSFARALVGFGLMQVVNVSLALAMTGWKMLALSPWLSLLTALPVIVGVLVVERASRSVMSLHRRSQEELGELSNQVLGTLQGMATIQGFVAEERFVERFTAKNTAIQRTRLRIAILGSLAFPALLLAGSVAVWVVLSVGGPLAVAGELTVGDLAAFVTLLGILLPPLSSIGWMISVFQRGGVSLTRIFELLDAPLERPGDQRLPEPGWSPAISLRDLAFFWPGSEERPALQGISVELPAGSVVGILGRTGSGKSTLVDVLTRLSDPPRGTVFVRDPSGREVDLIDIQLEDWQRRLSLAAQRPFLFSDTIAQNIDLEERGDPQELERVLREAALAPDLAALRDGLQTLVGERGIMLSGGQRQRVALARALFKNADLLVLDDVLSAVDHHTEARLAATLSALPPAGRRPTTIIVSHRVSAFQHADLVLVLEEGRLVEQGSPSELLARPGPFRETWLAQRPEGVGEVRE